MFIKGIFFSNEDLFREPSSNRDDVYTIIIKEDKSRGHSPMNVSYKRQSYSNEQNEEQNRKRSPSANKKRSRYGETIEIVDLEEFEDKLIKYNENKVSVLFLVHNRAELEKYLPKYEEICIPYSSLIEAYYYIVQEGETSIHKIENRRNLPYVLVYNGDKKIICLDGEKRWINLAKLLGKIQRNFDDVITGEVAVHYNNFTHSSPQLQKFRRPASPRSRTRSNQENGDLKKNAFVTLENFLHSRQITEKEYYFLKCNILENEKTLLSFFASFTK